MINMSIILKNGKVYEPVPELQSNSGCEGCAFRYSTELCKEACEITPWCYEKDAIWKEVEVNRMKSITQEIRDFNSSMMNEFETQLPGTKYDQDKLQYTLIPPNALV